MKTAATWMSACALWALLPAASQAVTGDVNRDGVVDLDDFFLLAENFGKTGPPETYRDTVYLSSEVERPPIRSSWSDVVDEVEPAVYWIGYTARPQGNTRYNVTFVGTGFAIDAWSVLTNHHVGSYLNALLKTVESDLEPVAIAVRAGTPAFGESTYYLGAVNEDRNLLGYWHLEYDWTVQSPDLAIFHAYDPDTDSLAGDLDFVRLASADDAMIIRPGDEIGLMGFPGPLETDHSPYTLIPTPTFKRGTISAIRAFDESVSLRYDWHRALMGVLVQHDLDTSPGNSGSPLFNRRAEVIAIHSSGIPGGDALDLGIRADEIRRFLKALYAGLTLGSHINAKPVAGHGPYGVEPYEMPSPP